MRIVRITPIVDYKAEKRDHSVEFQWFMNPSTFDVMLGRAMRRAQELNPETTMFVVQGLERS